MEQILQKRHLKKINLFEQSIRSEETKKVYITCLKKYFEFPGAIKVIDNVNPDGKKVENHIIDFISLKKQGKGFAAISNCVSAICKYNKMNDVVLDTNKIHQYLPKFRKSKKDRAYRYEEIHRLLDVADERMRAIIFLLASTGMRIGAIPGLRLRNLEKLNLIMISTRLLSTRVLMKNTLLFAPECTRAIDEYLRCGSNMVRN